MTTNERLKILNMIAEGQVTPEDGARLLEALNAPGAAPTPQAAAPATNDVTAVVHTAPATANGAKPTRLRVRVTSKDGSGSKVHVNLPLSLIDVGLRIGGRFVPELENFDDEMDTILHALKNDVHGKIVEVEDDGEHVEIYLE